MKKAVIFFVVIFSFSCSRSDYSVKELIDKEKFAEADHMLDSLLQQREGGNDLVELYRDKAYTSEKLGDLDTATHYYILYLAKETTDGVAWNNLGHIYNQRSKYEFSLKCFNNASELNPSDPVPFLNKARAEFNLERYTDALRTFEKASEKGFKLNDEDKLILATIHHNLGSFEIAESHFEKIDAAQLDAYSFETFFITLLKSGNEIRAKVVLMDALEKFPDDPISLNMASHFYSEIETDLDKALSYAERSIRFDSSYSNLAYQNRCLILVKSGRLRECCDLLNEIELKEVYIYPELIEACDK